MSLPPILVDNTAVARFAERLQQEIVIAVDLEADSLHSYQDKVCLLQFSTPAETVLVDPLKASDLSPFAPALSDPSIRKIFHAADYDIRCLYRDFRLEIRGLFDTMIASQLLGEEKIGLADMLRKYLGVELDKRYQRADWSQRPLEEGMILYAAEDTRHLHTLARILEDKLVEKGRLDWAREEFALLEQVRHSEQEGPLFLRFKKAGTLDRRQLGVLETLLQWRDGEARRRDCPPFKVVGNAALLELARIMPVTLKALVGIEGLPPKLSARYGPAFLQAIETGKSLPAERLPVYPRGEPRVRDPEAEERVALLKKWRTEKAAELEIDPGVLINNNLLEEIARTQPRGLSDLEKVSGMKDWQRRELGEGILQVLQG
ncbi:MAG: HRDC domain-containing protein [Syntrophotaleaceae bacterium]